MYFRSLLLFLATFTSVSCWGWGNYGNHGQQVANNNVGIGYPTAYGLWTGRAGYNNNGWDGHNNHGNVHPSQGTGFGSPLRCLNGGAHIGQCRLDKDSICIALGGTCIHGACCTTPFIGLVSSTTQAPLIEGEVTIGTGKRRITKKPTTIDKNKKLVIDSVDPIEIEEFNRVIEAATSTTPMSTTESSIHSSAEEEDYELDGNNDQKQCVSGLRAVGPCNDDDDCPSLHNCENNQCCYIV